MQDALIKKKKYYYRLSFKYFEDHSLIVKPHLLWAPKYIFKSVVNFNWNDQNSHPSRQFSKVFSVRTGFQLEIFLSKIGTIVSFYI